MVCPHGKRGFEPMRTFYCQGERKRSIFRDFVQASFMDWASFMHLRINCGSVRIFTICNALQMSYNLIPIATQIQSIENKLA